MSAKSTKAKPAAKTAKPSGHLPILGIEGIGPKFESKLKKAGVKSSADLAATHDIKALAEKTDIPEVNLRLWKSMATLLPVKGVGAQYAEVLARTGIGSVKDLASCEPDRLSERINALLDAKSVTITGAKITPKRVEGWIEAAEKLTGPIATPKPSKARKAGKLTVDARADTPVATKGKKFSKVAAEIQGATSNALPRPMKVRQEHPEIKENQGGELAWAEEAFWAFFGDEIDMMTSLPAEIFNDRSYAWRCECCDAALRIPRRTTVFHGDYEIVHDDNEGLLVNGVRHVPGAYTPQLQVVQPGRLRNPWSGKLIEGKDLGTTGVKAH